MSLERFSHYKTGIPSIDVQHWELLELLKNAKNDDPKNKPLVLKHLKDFIDKLDRHFENEERIMDEINFPYKRFHIENHIKFYLR